MSGKLTYKQSGVDTKEAAAFVSDISSHVKRTQKQRSLHQAFGLFAAAYDLSSYKEPVIVTGCDGVGTKTEILFELDMVETAGKDLVAMNVNDILTTGGDPLLFLDYLGISNLEQERTRITRLVAGMCDYLESCNCILAGGETAEMPGVVPESIVELSGFCIGCCEKSKLIDPKTVRPGDVFIGYKSDSFHANGWSLIRRILEENPDVKRNSVPCYSPPACTMTWWRTCAASTSSRRHTPTSRGAAFRKTWNASWATTARTSPFPAGTTPQPRKS